MTRIEDAAREWWEAWMYKLGRVPTPRDSYLAGVAAVAEALEGLSKEEDSKFPDRAKVAFGYIAAQLRRGRMP